MTFRPFDNGSVFFRRILMLLMGALLLSAVLTLLIYSFASNIVFTNIKTQELTEKAAIIADKTADRYLGDLSVSAYNSYMDAGPDLLDTNIIVFMYRGESFDISYLPNESVLTVEDVQEAKNIINQHNYKIMNRRTVSFREQLGEENRDYLFVGYPIIVMEQYSQSQTTTGAVYLFNSLEEIRESYTNLNFALILASSIVFLLVLIPLVFVSQKLIRPLVETKNVALAMSRGDFSKRAKIGSNDEIGELAKAVNNLADDLDKTLRNLKAERNRLQQILNGLGEGILAVTNHGSLMHINPSLLRLFHLYEIEEDEAYMKIMDLCNLEEPINQVMASGETREIHVIYRGRNISIRLDSLYDSKNEIYAVVALFRDTTEAEQLEQTRRDYVSNVSHELRTPLTAVRGLVEPLMDGIVKKEDDRMRYYGIILQETLRLSRLIDDMMALSRLQSGSVAMKPERLDPMDILMALEYKYESTMLEHEINFEVKARVENLEDIYSNEDRIEQILVIFLDNAMKFTDADGFIHLELVELPQYPDRYVFQVEDNGRGIAEEDQEHIFDRFYKVNKSRGRSEGTGLGLSIAKELSIQMGEHVWVRSTEGKGSCFYLTVKKYKEDRDNE